MNGSTSPFPSFSSESSSVSAAQEALTAAINTPVPLPAAQKPNGSMHWDAPPPSGAASSAGNIWGSGNNVSTSASATSLSLQLLQCVWWCRCKARSGCLL